MGPKQRYVSAIKAWPAEERPRERLLAHGPATLTTAELLAILLRTGTGGQSAVELARSLLEKAGGLRELDRRAAEELQRRVEAVAPLLRQAGEGARVLVYGMPDAFDGAYCFRNGGHLALRGAAGRRDVTIVDTWYVGLLDQAIIIDPRTWAAVDDTNPAGPIPLPEGGGLAWDFGNEASRAACLPIGGEAEVQGGAWIIRSRDEFPCILLPAVRMPPASGIRISVDGEIQYAERSGPVPVAVRFPDGHRLQRIGGAADSVIALPASVGVVRPELVGLPGTVLRIRGVSIRAVP